MKFFGTVAILLSVFLRLGSGDAAARETLDINRGWKFFSFNERDSVTVNLPHSWNTSDALAGRPDYYRGQGNYLRYINIKPEWRGRRIFVRFRGAGKVADVMVNSRWVTSHAGSSDGFVAEITDRIDFAGKNLLWVVVNNAARTDVLPTAGEENAYGGLYRDVELIVTDRSAIGLDEWGSDGVMFQPREVTAERARGRVGVKVNAAQGHQVRLDLTISDGRDSVVVREHITAKLARGVNDLEVPFDISSPHLWHGTEDPYLYNVSVKMTDGEATDSVSLRTGFRTVSVDSRTGFSLNGKPYPLRGVVLYRDRVMYGPVARTAQLAEELDIIREMGANAIRVAGGSHSDEFYRLCDERGLVVITDSPFVGAATLESKGFYDTPEFKANARRQLTEAILQHYNNPCIAAWGIFSEPELRGDDPLPLIGELHALAGSLDPRRLTFGVSNRDGAVNRITDLVVWSHTLGWRDGMPGDIALWRDQLSADPLWREIRSAVSYRAAGSVRHQGDFARKPSAAGSWHPEGWQTHVHEVFVEALGAGEGFWGIFVGDMFDHGSAKYSSGEGNGIVDCGLVTFDRRVRKDAFWLYKALWNPDPMVYIAGRREDVRTVGALSVDVFSNAPTVELFVDGESAGERSGMAGIFRWEGLELTPGNHTLSARTALAYDTISIKVVAE